MPGRWHALAYLFVARGTMGFHFQSLAAVSPSLVKDLALDYAALGALVGVWMLPGIFFALPGGALGRRFGDRPMVIAGLAVMALGTLLCALGGSAGAVLAGRFLSGIGAAVLNVLLTKMTADWFEEGGMSTALSIVVASWPVGMGLALFGLGAHSAATSWSASMMLTFWITAAVLAAFAAGYRSPPKARPAAPGESSVPGRRALLQVSAAGVAWMAFNVGFTLLVSFAPVMLVERGMTAAAAAGIASLATWPLLASMPLGGVVSDRTGRPRAVILASFAGMALCMAAFGADAPAVLVVLAFGALSGPCAGPIISLPARDLQPATRALGMGLFFTWYYAGMALVPPLAGWARDASGAPAAPLWVGIGVLALGAAAVRLHARVSRRGGEAS